MYFIKDYSLKNRLDSNSVNFMRDDFCNLTNCWGANNYSWCCDRAKV